MHPPSFHTLADSAREPGETERKEKTWGKTGWFVLQAEAGASGQPLECRAPACDLQWELECVAAVEHRMEGGTESSVVFS